MKTAKTYILTITLTSIFIVVGFFLPEWMIAYKDQNIIDKVRFETIESQKIVLNSEASMIEKIGLLRDYPQNVNRITLEMGTNFNLDSASAKFFEEISVLTKLGLLPEIEQSDKTTVKIDVSLYAQKDEPSTSGVFWNIDFQKGEFSGNFYMDDTTGRIIQFVVTMSDKTLNVDNAIESWSKYLGFKAQNIESQPETHSIWEDEKTKVSEGTYNIYNFELGFEDNFLPYAFYTFENGYGFGYIMKSISGYYDTLIKIR
ncbi:MAG: hypothetical protein GX023_03025 [Tissierellia bacterium]|nr:hypothetical protein [Tissierellia bacterium]